MTTVFRTVPLYVSKRDVKPNPSPYSTWMIEFPNDGGLIVGAYPSPRPGMRENHLDKLLSIAREDLTEGIDVYWRLCTDANMKKMGNCIGYINNYTDKIDGNIESQYDLKLETRPQRRWVRVPQFDHVAIHENLASASDKELLEYTAYTIAKRIFKGKLVYMYDSRCRGLCAVISILVILMIYRGGGTSSIETERITHHVHVALSTIQSNSEMKSIYDNCAQRSFITRTMNSDFMKNLGRDVFSNVAGPSFVDWLLITYDEDFDHMMNRIDQIWKKYTGNLTWSAAPYIKPSVTAVPPSVCKCVKSTIISNDCELEL